MTLTTLVLLALLAVLLVDPLFLEDEPRVTSDVTPTPEDVQRTRTLVRNLRQAIRPENPEAGVLKTDIAELNSAIKLGARFIPELRGQSWIENDVVVGEVSIPFRWWTGERWLNLRGTVPEFDGQLHLRELQLGATSLPPGFTFNAAQIVANLFVGDQFGDRIADAPNRLSIEASGLTVALSLDEMGKNGLLRGAFGELRGRDMPTANEVEEFANKVRLAMENGELSETGSFLPYLQFTLSEAVAASTESSFENTYTAAIMGLAKVCGARDFAMIVGRLVFDKTLPEREWSKSCADVTLNGRIDSRRHFLTSAAIQAASNRGFAVSLGEFKELFDALPENVGGFDFTDMAANLSGIEMSNYLMAQPLERWPDITARLTTERDVIVDYDGIPMIMPRVEFTERFGDVDSQKYKAMIGMIEARIDALSLYDDAEER